MIKTACCLLVVASALGAQTSTTSTTSTTTTKVTTVAAAPSVMDDVRALWLRSTDYLVRSAVAVPESTYTFQPTPAVRTFGKLIAHVAGAQNMFCALALGEKAHAEDEYEKRTTKASLVEALKESNAYCARAYAQADAAVAGTVSVFGRPGTRRSVLLLNTTHNFEHYGNVITYMRLKGMVPPSSQPAQ